MNECPHCRRPLPEPVGRFCPYCGGDLQSPPPPEVGAPGAPLPEAPPPAPLPPWSRPPVGPPEPSLGGTPWEQRDRLGFGAALLDTTKQVLTSPTRFFQAMRPEGGIGQPLLYAVIVGYVGLLANAIYEAVLRGVLGTSFGFLPRGSEWERLMTSMSWGATLVGQALFGPIAVVVGVFVFAGIVHVMLLLVSGARRGFEATFRVSAYSEAAMLLGLIPICGGFFSAVLYVILAIIGLGEAHGIGKGKAALAVLLPLILVCCCCGAAIMLLIGGLAGALGRMS